MDEVHRFWQHWGGILLCESEVILMVLSVVRNSYSVCSDHRFADA